MPSKNDLILRSGAQPRLEGGTSRFAATTRGVASGLLLASWMAAPALAAAPAPSSVTPELIDAAKKEGTVVFYTSIELQTAEKIGEAFEKAYPGIHVQVERNGAERIFQRLMQERGAGIHTADVVECSDMTALYAWKQPRLARALRAAGRHQMAGRPA